jgi:hypothetical protein
MEHGPQPFSPEIFWALMTAQIVFWLLMGAIFAIGFWFVAGRVGRTRWAWALLSIIPFVNFFFFIYAFFRVLLYGIDRINDIAAAAAAAQEGGPNPSTGRA